MDNTAADKAGYVHATATVAGAAPPVLPTRFHSFGLSSIKSFMLVTAPAHSHCSADVSRHSIRYGSRHGSCLNLLLNSDRPGHICAGKGLSFAASAQGLDTSLPHLPGAGLIPAISAPGPGSPLRHLLRDSAYLCTSLPGLGTYLPTSAPELVLTLPHLHRDRVPHPPRDVSRP
jgi:hypothetical protein